MHVTGGRVAIQAPDGVERVELEQRRQAVEDAGAGRVAELEPAAGERRVDRLVGAQAPKQVVGPASVAQMDDLVPRARPSHTKAANRRSLSLGSSARSRRPRRGGSGWKSWCPVGR
jgi:hypothetical protein